MKIFQLDIDHALRTLHTTRSGLSSSEAQLRLQEFGLNQIVHIKRKAWWVQLLSKFTQFFALILWVAALLAFVADYYEPHSGMLTLGFAIIGVIVLNGLFTFWQEVRTERLIAALKTLLPHQVTTVRDLKAIALNANALVPGDLVELSAGNIVPADILLIEGYNVTLNMAAMTGESTPVLRDALTSRASSALTARNVLLAGTTLTNGEAKGIVFATGIHTELGQIAHLTQTVEIPDSPLLQEVRRLSRLIALLATSLGLLFFGIGHFLGFPFWANFIFAIGIIVANVPEGLLPTVTLALAMGTQRLAKRNALIRYLPSLETLGSVTVICTDKTGTLTENKMAASALFINNKILEVNDIDKSSLVNNTPFFEAVKNCIGMKELNGDPLENALQKLARRFAGSGTPQPCIEEIPFSPERRIFSSLHPKEEGFCLYTKGALESLLKICTSVRQNGQDIPLTEELKEQFLSAEKEMAQRGLYVLSFASRFLKERIESELLESSLTLQGIVGLFDPPRDEVKEALSKCRTAGVRTIMITGDHPETARAIAAQIGLGKLETLHVVTGGDLEHMTPSQLHLTLKAPELIFARVHARQKMRIVSALKRMGEIVAVTGDGVNDAPALRHADIGIAMGRSGTDVARESSDLVLMDDHFATIVNAIEEGRTIFANIRKFLTYILTSNIPELIPYLAFSLFKIPLGLTIVQMLAVDLCTDVVPALGLGAEPAHPEVMQRPPRRKGERLINFSLMARAYLFLGPIEAAIAMSAFYIFLKWGGWSYGTVLSATDPLYLQGTTVTLITIITLQILNVFLCKEPSRSVFKTGWLTNKIILLGILLEIGAIFAITYTPLGNFLLRTAPFNPHIWLFILPMGALMLLLEELRKKVAAALKK